MDERFILVGARTPLPPPEPKRKWYEGRPVVSMAVLAGIVLGCLCCGIFAPGDPGYMDLQHSVQAPGRDFWFGTDTMGRDIFAMIWYGGRVSLTGRAVNGGVLVTVEDSGPGMTQEKLSRVLRGEDGGLGLAIVQRLLKQNGGSLTVRTAPGQGTRALLTFHGTGGTS